jgi:hypothetical protein
MNFALQPTGSARRSDIPRGLPPRLLRCSAPSMGAQLPDYLPLSRRNESGAPVDGHGLVLTFSPLAPPSIADAAGEFREGCLSRAVEQTPYGRCISRGELPSGPTRREAQGIPTASSSGRGLWGRLLLLTFLGGARKVSCRRATTGISIDRIFPEYAALLPGYSPSFHRQPTQRNEQCDRHQEPYKRGASWREPVWAHPHKHGK